jgi:tetratricopeptide (TPR) repeat protein
MNVARGAGAMPTLGEVLGALSMVEITKGELDRAIRYQQQALDIFREVDARSWIPRVQLNYGHLLRLRGRLEEAADAFTESLEICRTMSQGPCVYEALAALALVRTHEDELERAESLLEEALAHTTTIDYLRAVGESHGRLSIVLTEMRRFPEAEVSARKAMEFYKDHFGDRNTYGELALAIALAAQGRRDEGQEVSDALVEALGDWRRDLPWSLEVVLKAEILSAWFSEDMAALREIRERADEHALVHVSLDARFAQAELQQDLAKLEAIERDALEHRYPLLARKTAETASSW